MTWRIDQGDVLQVLATYPDESVNCVVTSPPYWGLRDYGAEGQIGSEKTPQEFVAKMVEVFAEIRRVLTKDGSLWLNLGDSYATGTTSNRSPTATGKHGYWQNPAVNKRINGREIGLKPKDMVGIPWRTAFALQDDGWWLRSDIVWFKPNPMPESVTDRPTKAHEFMFLMTKSARYYYDADAINEPCSPNTHARLAQSTLMEQRGGFKQEQYEQGFPGKKNRDRRPAEILQHMARAAGVNPKAALSSPGSKQNASFSAAVVGPVLERNKRDVWEIPTEPFPGAHFATFPTELVKPCILAGCPEGGTVLDPFAGSGTTLMVALRHNRNALGIELNPEYVAMARERIRDDAPLFNGVNP